MKGFILWIALQGGIALKYEDCLYAQRTFTTYSNWLKRLGYTAQDLTSTSTRIFGNKRQSNYLTADRKELKMIQLSLPENSPVVPEQILKNLIQRVNLILPDNDHFYTTSCFIQDKEWYVAIIIES